MTKLLFFIRNTPCSFQCVNALIFLSVPICGINLPNMLCPRSEWHIVYNNVSRLLFGYRRSCSASEMFVYNNIYNFEGRLRKNINDFTMRIGSSSNVLIATLRENSFILAGPLRQKWITSVLFIISVVIV